jgi:hypothetical protein
MRQIIEVVVLAALVIILTALPGHAGERTGAASTAPAAAVLPAPQNAGDVFWAFEAIVGG